MRRNFDIRINKDALLRVSAILNSHLVFSLIQDRVSYNLFFSRLIVSRQKSNVVCTSSHPEKVHNGLLPSLSLCRSCEVGKHGAL